MEVYFTFNFCLSNKRQNSFNCCTVWIAAPIRVSARNINLASCEVAHYYL